MKSIARQSLNLNMRILTTFGWWPPDSWRDNWKIYLYHNYSVLIIGFFFLMYILTEVINIIMVLGNMEETIESSFLLLTHMGQFMKFVTMIWFSKDVKEILDRFEEPLFTQMLPEHIKIQERCAQIVKRDTRTFLSLSISTIILWAIFPAFDTGTEWQLPLKAWYPFSTKDTPTFQLVYLYQIIAVMIDASTNVSTDTLASGVMVLTGGQLEILNYNLRSLEDPESTEESREKLYYKLKQHIKHHQDIIRITVDQADTFQTVYLGQFLVAVIVICITSFQLTLVPFSIKFVSMILYLSCMLMEIFLYCYHGNEIVLKSTEITRAISECNWYNQSEEFKKSLLFLMEMAKRPLKVTAGKLFSLSLATYMAILRSSYSYFAVLQHIHNK